MAGKEPTAQDIALLLEQCSPEEISSILASLEAPEAKAPAPAIQPVPPSAPPPGTSNRRPPPSNIKRPERFEDDLQQRLDEQRELLLLEVRRMLPPGADGSSLDLALLSQILVDREAEIKVLEAQLGDLHSELTEKDRRAADLGSELDATLREVRHRQLDLEFQQLKLEERVRSNAELEQAQRQLSARVEEAALRARHAAIDAEACRTTPRGLRVQGSLPWMLRKNRLTAGEY